MLLCDAYSMYVIYNSYIVFKIDIWNDRFALNGGAW